MLLDGLVISVKLLYKLEVK